ncbi:MAG: hypothetical protein K0B09_10450 [Bacteroidales bacterium]|nr:hypothetical protein [Bacteroidales bacterium]
MKKIFLFAGVMLVSVALLAQNPRSQQGQGREKQEEVKEQGQQRAQQGREQAEQATARERAQQGVEQAERQVERAEEGLERAEEGLERAKDAREQVEGRGHAYGRDKGGLSGRDFGQARAAAARTKEEKEEVTREVALEVEEGVRRTKTRVEEAREVLEERVKNREISEEEFEKRTRRIEEIEEEVMRIEEMRKETERVIRERLPEVERQRL